MNAYDLKQHELSIFSTVNQKSDDYFMRSGDQIRFFFEEKAFDDRGKLKAPIDRSINKIGHGLHIQNHVFKKFSHQPLYQNAVRALGYQVPVIAQSMYIFKQPGIGGVVMPHQDSTFLHTSPRCTVMGLWCPLQDATKENGCIWAIPGSHRNGVHNDRRMIRCVDPKDPWHISTTFTAPQQEYKESDFVPVEMKKGSVLLLHGLNVHMSYANDSPNSRHAYIIHVVESNEVVYDHLNWLQPSSSGAFPLL